MIISVPVQTALCKPRPEGQLAPVDVAVHVSVEGLYRPPSSYTSSGELSPPHTIISVPVQMTVFEILLEGQFAPVEVGVQRSKEGL